MRVALYMRMSTDKQENSIASQQNILISYTNTHKLMIVEKYIDEGISGRTAEKRPSFMRMIDDSAKDLFDAVLVYDSSRFARNLEESIVYKSVLKRNGVQLISATEPTLDDDSALITDAMLGALNEMYSRKLSKAVKRGMVYKAAQGKFQTPPPFGYVKSNGVLLINEQEADIVRKIFEMFIDCPSWHSVAVKLNDTGAQKRKSYGWYSRDIKRMLSNQTYIGNVFYDGNVYKGEHEPIITPAIWEKVQTIIDEKPAGKYRPPSSYKHWLSGLLRCANCGGRMNHMTDRRGNTSYRCSKQANGCCKYSNFMSVPKLEMLMKKALEEVVVNENLVKYEYLTPKPKEIDKLEFLNSSLKKNRSRLERHKAAYSNGVDTLEEYKENKEKCQKEEAEIIKQLETYARNDITDEKVTQLRKSASNLIDLLYSDEYTIEEKSISIRSIIEKIVFNKYTGEFDVYYYL